MNARFYDLLDARDAAELHERLRQLESACSELASAAEEGKQLGVSGLGADVRRYLDAHALFWHGDSAQLTAQLDEITQTRLSQATDVRSRYIAFRARCLLVRHLLRNGNCARAATEGRRLRPLLDSIALPILYGELAEIISRLRAAESSWDEALGLAFKAVRIYRNTGTDLLGEAKAWQAVGLAYFDMGDFASAHANLETSLHVFQQCMDDCGIADTQLLRSHLCYHSGDHARSQELLAEASDICGTLKYTRGSATALRYRGKVALQGRHIEQALGMFKDSLKLFEQINHPPGVARAHLSLARAYADARQWDQARAEYELAQELFGQLGDAARQAMAKVTKGILLARSDADVKARATADCRRGAVKLIELKEAMSREKDTADDVLRLLRLVRRETEQGNWSQASADLGRARTRFETSSDAPPAEREKLADGIDDVLGLLETLLDGSVKQEAMDVFAAGEEMFEGIGDRRHMAIALFEMAAQFRLWGDYSRAVELLERSLDRASSMHADRLRDQLQAEKDLTVTAAQLAGRAVALKKELGFREAVLREAVHDLKKPLGPFLLIMGILRNQDVTEEMRRKYDRIARNELNYLISLCDSILVLERSGGDSIRIRDEDRSTVNIRELAEQAMDMLRPVGDDGSEGQSGKAFVNDVPERTTAWADSVHILRVLVNLISNADQHTPSGSIAVTAHDDGDDPSMVRVTVSDTGLGIRRELRERVFDLYVSETPIDEDEKPGDIDAHDVAKYGIGLHYSKRAVESHGGRIWVDPERTRIANEDEQSPDRHGTVIHFTLPKAKPVDSR